LTRILLALISILKVKNNTLIFYLVALYRRQAFWPVFFNLNFKEKTTMKNGIIYKGPSLLDGKPIVVIATFSKRNTKTGEVVQTYILVDGINPLEASKTGADFSICGDCAMRGEVTTDPTRKQAKNRRCYVNLGQGVLIVYKSFLRGVYPMADNTAARKSIGRGRFVRVGTYGDPAAVPPAVWEELLSEADTFTAYSHQSGWRPDIAMQSADNHAQAVIHWKAGRRTFRVIADLGQLDKQNEALCPASKEAGRRVQCTACKLCKGSALAKSIAIVEH
jgi:hypothetical protein